MSSASKVARSRRCVWVGVVAALLSVLPIPQMDPIANASVGEVTFYGGGYGHGIGMSQYGAQGQALHGASADDILTHYYTGASLGQLAAISPASALVNYPQPIWVGIEQDLRSIEFIPRGGDLSICQTGSGCPKTVRPADGESWTVKTTSTPGECVFEKGGVQQGTTGDCWARVEMLGGARIEFPAHGVTVGHGTMRIRPAGPRDSAERFHVSFSMELEDYVLGIAEVPPSWEPAALQSQAIAARTYGTAKAHQRESLPRSGNGVDPGFSSTWKDICWCHVRRTTYDQAYGGWSQTQLQAWKAAVTETSGMVLTHPSAAYTYRGVIDAFYSSSTSGVTETNVGGFGSTAQFPYLISVDDHWSTDPAVNNPFATWSKTVSEIALVEALSPPTPPAVSRPWNVDFDFLTSVTHVDGPPESMVRIAGMAAGGIVEVEVPGWWLRSALGLRSPQISGVSADVSGAVAGQIWHQGGQIQSPIEQGDHFGAAVATGDFDGDGFADVAVSAPDDGINTVHEGGLVNVLYGDGVGLTDIGDQMIHQAQTGLTDPLGAEPMDHFGAASVASDFNDDGYTDLAIGTPDEDWAGAVDGGIVHVLEGGPNGLVFSGSTVFAQDVAGVPGWVEDGDRFGAALAAGDFDDDGFNDLAIGVPGEGIGSRGKAGLVIIIPGSSEGLVSGESYSLNQNSPGVAGAAEPGDQFGKSLAVGDIDGDGRADLVVGSPFEAIGSRAKAGMVHAFFGSPGGLSGSQSVVLHQGTAGVHGNPETGDKFGYAIAIGDITGDGNDDVAIGVPGESLSGVSSAGLVILMWGSHDRQISSGSSVHQNSPGVTGTAEHNDQFGISLWVGDLVADYHADLVIGVPGEDLGSKSDAGLVHLVPGSGSGILTGASSAFGQEGLPVPHPNEAGDRFGAVICAGYFYQNGRADLLVGSPGETLDGKDGAGLIQLVFDLS